MTKPPEAEYAEQYIPELCLKKRLSLQNILASVRRNRIKNNQFLQGKGTLQHKALPTVFERRPVEGKLDLIALATTMREETAWMQDRIGYSWYDVTCQNKELYDKKGEPMIGVMLSKPYHLTEGTFYHTHSSTAVNIFDDRAKMLVLATPSVLDLACSYDRKFYSNLPFEEAIASPAGITYYTTLQKPDEDVVEEGLNWIMRVAARQEYKTVPRIVQPYVDAVQALTPLEGEELVSQYFAVLNEVFDKRMTFGFESKTSLEKQNIRYRHASDYIRKLIKQSL